MASKSRINIVSKHSHEFSSNINVDDITYHVQTEDMGLKTSKIMSRVYLKGEVVFSRDSDYAHITKLKDFDKRLSVLIENHHRSTINMFIKEQSQKHKSKNEYFEEAKQLLKRGNGKSALNILEHALGKYPEDPFLLSYYGCLVALVKNRPGEGIKICEDAIEKLNRMMPYGSEFFYPSFYLNLGRAYVKGDRKKEAVDAFHQGLRNDPENRDLIWELKKLGTRKKLPVPFLKRSNPINKYIGLLINKSSK